MNRTAYMSAKSIIILLILFKVSISEAYQWPFADYWRQHQINSTLGEYRTLERFHNGVDIRAPAGTYIYVVEDGEVTEVDTDWVKVRDIYGYYYTYKHVVRFVKKDDKVYKPTLESMVPIGYTDSQNHLHFVDGDESYYYNPLFYLYPFNDYGAPVVEDIGVVKNGTPGAGEAFPLVGGIPVVFGDVDIKGTAYDPRVKSDGNAGDKGCGIYEIRYEILNEQESTVQSAPSNYEFDTITSKSVSWIYVSGSTYSPVNFIYWVTNYGASDGYWDSTSVSDGRYKIKVIAEDIKINTGSMINDVIIVDNNDPVISNLTPAYYSYINNPRPTISASLYDAGSGVDVNNIVMRLDGDEVPATKTASAVTYIPPSNLDEGSHYVYLKVPDKIGNVAEKSWSFCVDVTAPTDCSIIINNDDQYTGYVQVNLSLSASDNLSGLYQMRFRNEGGAWSYWRDYSTSFWGWGLNYDTGVGTRTVHAEFKDVAGNISSPPVSDSIFLDTTPPEVDPEREANLVSETGRYSTSTTITFNWAGDFAYDLDSGIAGYGLKVTRDDEYVHFDDYVGNVTTYNVTGCAHGRTYYAKVKAINGAGLESDWVEAEKPVTVDLTPPELEFIDDGDYTNDTTQLQASWSWFDLESGIAEHEYGIGTTPGSTDIAYWVSAGTDTAVTVTGLSLSEGTYYFTVKAENNAGLWSDPENGDGVIVDTTPPSVPIDLTADGSNPSPWKNTRNFSIDWTNPDDLSGIAGAYYRLESPPTHNTDGTYTTDKPFDALAADIEGSQTLFVWLKDNAGNINYLNNGTVTLRYDVTPPEVTDFVAEPFSPNRDLIKEITHISYSLSDNFSTMFKTTIEILTSSDVEVKTLIEDASQGLGYNSVIWNGEDEDGNVVTDGNYKCKIMVTDEAGNIATFTGTVIVDTILPVLSDGSITITPGNHPQPDVFTTNDDTVDVSFALFDELSPSAEARTKFIISGSTIATKIGSFNLTPGTTQVLTYHWDGLDDSGNPAPNGTYSVTVQATDAAGNTSELLSIPQTFRIDTVPSKITTLYVEPTIFIPEPPTNQTVTLTYALSDDADVEILIEDVFGNLVDTYSEGFKNAVSTYTFIWDGKKNGQFLSDGSYILRVKTTDDVDNTSSQAVSVIKNQIPAQITFPPKLETGYAIVGGTVTIIGIAIDPLVNDTTDFACYELWYAEGENVAPADYIDPSTSTWYPIPVPISNQISSDTDYPKSNVSYRAVIDSTLGIWDASSLLSGTTCTILVVAQDETQNYSYDSRTVLIDQTIASITSPIVTITQPEESTQFDIVSSTSTLKIEYALSGRPADVVVDMIKMTDTTIYGPVVRHWKFKEKTTGGTIFWDGRNYRRQYVDSGTYRIRVTAQDTDSIGTSVDEVSIIVNVIVSLPLKITKFEATKYVISPSTTTTISYELSKEAVVNVEIYDSQGSLLETLIDGTTVQQGGTTYSIDWGTSTEGLYTCKIDATATDEEQTTDSASFCITVSTTEVGIGIALITTPQDGAIVQGLSNFDWEATAQGEHYPPQQFSATVQANGNQTWMQTDWSGDNYTSATNLETVYVPPGGPPVAYYKWVQDTNADFLSGTRTNLTVGDDTVYLALDTNSIKEGNLNSRARINELWRGYHDLGNPIACIDDTDPNQTVVTGDKHRPIYFHVNWNDAYPVSVFTCSFSWSKHGQPGHFRVYLYNGDNQVWYHEYNIPDNGVKPYTKVINIGMKEATRVVYKFTMKSRRDVKFWIQNLGFYEAGCYSRGNIVSRTFDTGVANPTWGNFEATVEGQDGNNYILFFTQTSSNGIQWDGLVPAIPGQSINSASKRYIRWKAEFYGDGESTPVLDNVGINWKPQNGDIALISGKEWPQGSYADFNAGSKTRVTVDGNSVILSLDPNVCKGGNLNDRARASYRWQGWHSLGNETACIDDDNPNQTVVTGDKHHNIYLYVYWNRAYLVNRFTCSFSWSKHGQPGHFRVYLYNGDNQVWYHEYNIPDNGVKPYTKVINIGMKEATRVVYKFTMKSRRDVKFWIQNLGFYEAGYYSSGNIISQTFDTGINNPLWGNFEVSAQKPSGTNISYYTQVRNPSEPWDSWVSATPGQPVRSASKRYIRWRAYLYSNGEETPVLKSVTINWGSPSGELVSIPYDFGGQPTSWENFEVSEVKPTGTDIAYSTQVSSDGVHWDADVPIIPGQQIQSDLRQYIRWRTRLTSNNAMLTPILKEVKISAKYEPTTIFDQLCWYNHPFYSGDLSVLLPMPEKFFLVEPAYSIISETNPQVNKSITIERGIYELQGTTDLEESWSTAEDQGLTDKGIVSLNNEFNNRINDPWYFITESTVPTVISSAYPSVDMSAPEGIKNKYTFWKNNGSIIDNPYVAIDADNMDPEKQWKIRLYYPDEEVNNDLVVDKKPDKASNTNHDESGTPIDIDDDFTVKISTDESAPQVFIELKGETSTGAQGFKGYSMFYQKDGETTWKPIPVASTSPVTGGTLAYWNVTGLNNKYIVKLVVLDNSGVVESTTTIKVGKKVITTAIEPTYITSPYNKAFLEFPINSLAEDSIVTITPMRLSDTDIVVSPDMPLPIGALYKLQPKGISFDKNPDGSLLAPAVLRARFMQEEIEGIDIGQLTIYYVRDDGTIKPVIATAIYEDGNIVTVSCEVVDFSYYLVIPQIAPPGLNLVKSPTNKRHIILSGTAEANSTVTIYNNGAVIGTVEADEKGRFELTIPLVEGANPIAATTTRWFNNIPHTSPKSEPMIIILDTIPPEITNVSAFPEPFSPDMDGIDDKVKLSYNLSENALMTVEIYDSGNDLVRKLLVDSVNQAGPNSLIWNGRDEAGLLVSPGIYTGKLSAVDMAGNESRVVSLKIEAEFSDDIPPFVAITNPCDGAAISKSSVTIVASASDNGLISKVEFYIDDFLVYTDSSPLYNWVWDMTPYIEDSEHTIKATAYDIAGNSASDEISVTIEPEGFHYTITATGTETVDLSFNWTVTGTGTETYVEEGGYNSKSIVNRGWYHSQTDYLYPSDTTYTIYDWYCDNVVSYGGRDDGTYIDYANNRLVIKTYSGYWYYYPGYYSADYHVRARKTVTAPAKPGTDSGSGTVNRNEGNKFIDTFSAYPTPKHGGTISGVTYTVTDNNANVETWLSGNKVYARTDYVEPWSATESGWATVSEKDGDKYITTSTLVAPNNDTIWTVTDDNPDVYTWMVINDLYARIGDVAPPVISIVEPHDGTSISGTTTITVEATDNLNVLKVEFYIDGELKHIQDTSPYSWAWYTLPYREELHTIQTVAYDKYGNFASDQIGVVVDNTLPEIIINSPKAGDKYISTQNLINIDFLVTDLDSNPTVNASLTDMEEGTKIEVTNGQVIAPIDLDDGFWTLTVEAKDWANNESVLTTGQFEVIHDLMPPRTVIHVGEPKYGEEPTYVNRSTQFTLVTIDDLVKLGDEVGLGIEQTEYRVDEERWVDYRIPFTILAEGEHTIYFHSIDVADNSEDVHSLKVFVDNTPPSFSEIAASPDLTSLGLVNISFRASEPLRENPIVTVNGNPATFVSFISPYNYSYEVTERDEEGKATIFIRGVDYAGNVGTDDTGSFVIDYTAPEITINSPQVGAKYIATIDKIVTDFLVKDNLDPDPSYRAYLTDQEEGTVIEVSLGQEIDPLDIDDGYWTFTVEARDWVNNAYSETTGQFEVIHDIQPPRTTINVGEPKYSEEPVYVTSATEFTLTAVDDLIEVGDGKGLGVAETKYKVDDEEWVNYTTGFTILLAGNHAIYYYGIDVVGNVEETDSISVAVDSTSPETTLSSSKPLYNDGVRNFASSEYVFFLNATDNLSGVNHIEINIDESGYETYISPVSFITEGEHIIRFKAVDNVANWEEEKVFRVIIDNTPPTTNISIGIPKDDEYINSTTPLTLLAVDAGLIPCGVHYSEYRINSGLWTPYTQPFYISGDDGTYTVEYRSVDNVDNTEHIKSVEVKLDNTPPVSTVNVIGGHQYISEDKFYASIDTRYSISAEDPVINGVAVGLEKVEYRIDSEPWQEWIGTPISFSEGIHNIEYFAYDRLGNREETNLLIVYVDNSPPVTEFVPGDPHCRIHGEPLERSHEYTVVSSRTPLILEATDPIVKGVASGVSRSYYKISDSDWIDYLGSFSLTGSDGDYTIAYYSVDNVENAEAHQFITVILDNTSPEVQLISPSQENTGLCKMVKGIVTIIGSTSDLHFKWYKIEYGKGNDPSQWNLIKNKTYVEVEEGVLATWNTTSLSEGWYTLKLTAQDCVQNEGVSTVKVYVGKPELVLKFGSEGKGEGEFNHPSYIELDVSGNIYITDSNNSRVQKFDPQGSFLMQFGGKGSGEGEFNNPTGIALDSSGNIYVVDRNNNRVQKFNYKGEFLSQIGRPGDGPGEFNKPHGIAIDSQSNIYVADRNNDRVQKFDSNGNFLMQINTGIGLENLNKPQGVIAVDSLGKVYVTDRNNDRILIFDSEGNQLMELGGSGSGAGQLNKPDGITVNDMGYIYVADSNNDRIQKFDKYGNFMVAFGVLGDDDGQFNKPSGIALDNFGNLLVVDRNNSRIQKFGVPPEEERFLSMVRGFSGTELSLSNVVNYPNPFNSNREVTKIRYTLSKNANVTVKIYNIIGKLVYTFDEFPAGFEGGSQGINEISWNGRNDIGEKVHNGVYIYKIKASDGNKTVEKNKRLAVVK